MSSTEYQDVQVPRCLGFTVISVNWLIILPQEMNEGKMSRGNNWLYEQKLLLLELIEKNLDVLEEKKTDA